MPRTVKLTEPGPLAESSDIAAVVIRHSPYQSSRFPVTRAELETIVQQAYDQHGIIAAPSYAKEAEGRRIEDARDVSDQSEYLAATDDFLFGGAR